MRSDLSLIAAARPIEKKRKMHTRIATALLAIFATVVSAPSPAGTGSWTTNGPGGNVNAIALDYSTPSQILVSTGSGLARTSDSGSSWISEAHGTKPTDSSALDPLYTFPSVNLVRLHEQSNVLFAGTSGRGLLRNFRNATQPPWPTTCGSATLPDPLPSSWEQTALPGGVSSATANIRALNKHPFQPWIAISIPGSGLYVLQNAGAAPTTNIGTCPAGAYVTSSTFAANTWTAVTTQLPATSIASAIVFDPSQAHNVAITSAVIYAATAGQGIYLTLNGGADWGTPGTQTVTSGTFSPSSANIVALTAATSGSVTTLYAATTGTNAGVYKGVVTLGATLGTTSIAWTPLTSANNLPGLSNVRAIAFDSITPTKIYAGTFGYGVYAYDPNASTTDKWTDISNGLNNSSNSLYVTALEVDPLNPSRIYAGTYGGAYVYRTYDDQPKTGLTPSSSTLTFSNTTSSQTITLTNNNSGTTPIAFDFSKWAIGGNFKYTHGCPNSLKPGQACNVTITYAPSKYATNENGILTITSDDPSSPTTITLQGTSNAALAFTDNSTSKSLYFAQTNVGSTSTSQSVVLWNQSLVDDVLSFAFSSTEFTMDGDCLPATSTTTSGGTTTTTTLITSTLPALQSCSLVFAFRPTQAGSKTASLDINGNQKGHLAITLTGGGSGGSTSSGTASVSASLLSFPGVPPHQQSATQSLTLTNTSAQALTISAISTDNSAFIVDSSACPNSLSANASCKILLAYTPVDENPTTSTLTIQLGSSSLTVQLSGTSADLTSLTGTAYGSTASRSLIGNFFFSSREKAKTGNLYIAAQVNGTLFFFDGISWFPWVTGTPRAFVSSTTYADQSVSILNRMDTTTLRGVPIYLGFGSSVSDLQKNQTYSQIYVLQ